MIVASAVLVRAWVSTPNLFIKIPVISKNVELFADGVRFWPISRIKACCGEGEQELRWGYFRIGPYIELDRTYVYIALCL